MASSESGARESQGQTTEDEAFKEYMREFLGGLSEGPLTAEKLIPLLSIIAEEKRLEDIKTAKAQIDPFVLDNREVLERLKKSEKEITVSDLVSAFLRLRRGNFWKKILEPTLRRRFPEPGELDQQINTVAAEIKIAKQQENEEKRMRKE